jgi:Dioxygenase
LGLSLLIQPSLQITHPSYKSITTQIFPADDPHLSTDSVFAVKDDLVVDFKPLSQQTHSRYLRNSEDRALKEGDASRASLDLEYNVILAPEDMERGG